MLILEIPERFYTRGSLKPSFYWRLKGIRRHKSLGRIKLLHICIPSSSFYLGTYLRLFLLFSFFYMQVSENFYNIWQFYASKIFICVSEEVADVPSKYKILIKVVLSLLCYYRTNKEKSRINKYQ